MGAQSEMSKKGISKALEQEVAASFLLGTRRYDHREFLMELNRVGLKFIKDKVDSKNHKRFTAAFDKLVGLGCLPETLAGTLYCFCKSYVVRNPRIPPYGLGISFPPDRSDQKVSGELERARLKESGALTIMASWRFWPDTQTAVIRLRDGSRC